jgi:DNA-binding MarR family transcriptional regulator
MAAQTVESLDFFIQHVATLLARQSDQVLQEQLGIGLSQYKILRILQDNSRIQQKQIADLLGQTEASISRQIKLLTGRQMINSSPNPANRREHLTTLTSRGVRILEAANTVLEQYHASTLNTLSTKEQATLLKLLGTLHRPLCVLDDDASTELTHPGAPGTFT